MYDFPQQMVMCVNCIDYTIYILYIIFCPFIGVPHLIWHCINECADNEQPNDSVFCSCILDLIHSGLWHCCKYDKQFPEIEEIPDK